MIEDISKYDIAILNCQHKYHLHCIQKWNNKSKDFKRVCPQYNIDNEIINIVKGDSSAPISPVNTELTQPINTSYTYRPTNQPTIENIQRYTYYDERFNMSNVTLINENDEILIERQRRRRQIQEEIDSTIICCTIL